jgi:hypothetical protein
MFAPATTPEPRQPPLCPTCIQPMALMRTVTVMPGSELRVFACGNCAIVMFTEIS